MRRRLLPFASLLALAAVLYANSLRNPFVFDDVDAIVENPHLRALWPPSAALAAPPGSGSSGRPLVALSLAVNHALGGLDPLGYHVFNVAAHVLGAWMLLALVGGTLRLPRLAARSGGRAGGIAFAVAVLWLVHPLHTAALDHVIYRNEVLAALALLAVLVCLMRGARSPRPHRWHVASVLAGAAGMACKETMVAAPLLAFLYDSLFLARGPRDAWKSRRGVHLGLAATWLVLAACIAGADRGASVTTRWIDLGPLDYARTQLGVVVHYLRLAFWPAPLVLDYDWPVAHGVATVALPGLVLAALAAATAWALRRRSGLAFPGAVFFLVLAPSSSLVPLAGAVAAEHRMYLPLAAVVVVVVLGAEASLVRYVGGVRMRRAVALGLTVVVAAALGAATARRNITFSTEVSIWRDTAAKRPANPRAWGNLGAALLRAGSSAAAVAPLETAVRLQPGYVQARLHLGTALGGRAARRAAQGDDAGAAADLRRALEVAPGETLLQNNLAWILVTSRDPAVRDPETGLRLALDAAAERRGNWDVMATLAAAFAASGRSDEAATRARAYAQGARRDGRTALAESLEARAARYAAGSTR
jgi:tetratricopeptide (TPR) repeat protein